LKEKSLDFSQLRGLAAQKLDSVNYFTDEQLNLLATVPKHVFHINSLYTFCLGCETISQRAARRQIILYPKQNIYSEPNKTNSLDFVAHLNALCQI